METMNDSKNVHRLESDLQNEKQDLRQDLEEIAEKARETRAELNPMNLVREKIFLLSGLALALGFALGYRRFPIEDVGKPVARTVLSSIGKQAGKHAVDAISGRGHENG
jgi:hypothetical protein